MNTAAVDDAVMRELRAEIRRLRADIRALLPLAEAVASEAPTWYQRDLAETLCQRARKALTRRSP